MKIIGINTSPREGSNVRIALENALEASKAKGAETEIFDIIKMNITACQGDNYCKSHEGKCAVDDDMQKIYKAIEEADGVILATPVYFFDVNAQAKLFIDRLYSYFQFPFVETYGTKKFAMIVSQGMEDPELFKGTLNKQVEAFGFLGFDVQGLTVVPDNNIPGAIKDKENQLAQVKAVGEKIVE